MPLSTPYVCGEASASSSDTLVIPISADVPRTDPVLGASFVFVFYQLDGASTALPLSFTDDATADDDYSTCLFADGLNHYAKDTGPAAGLIVNPLVNGVNNITLQFDDVSTFLYGVAIAVTGIGAPGAWPAAPFDPSVSWWPGSLLQDPGAEAPVGAPTTVSVGPGWHYASPTNAVVMTEPTGAVTDENWDWANGEVALYAVKGGHSTDPDGFTWADGAIVSLADYHLATGVSGSGNEYIWGNVGYGLIVPTLAGPSVAGALGDASSLFGSGGSGVALVPGDGPPPCATPPLFGNPCFNRVIPA